MTGLIDLACLITNHRLTVHQRKTFATRQKIRLLSQQNDINRCWQEKQPWPHMFHEVIAAAGGLLFIALGIGRQRERKQLITAGVKAESPLVWEVFVISGVCLVCFSFGLIIYQLTR